MSPPRPVTPKSLVLDLLRASQPRAMPVRTLVAIGALFGLTENAVRVAVTRLVAAGTLESDERGSYRLGPKAVPLSGHVEGWRLGEQRLRPWSGAWLAVWLPRGTERSARRRSRRALELLGFREGLEGLWVRPDNLSEPHVATVENLKQLGLEQGMHPFRASDFEGDLVSSWMRLWNPQALSCAYRDACQALEVSLQKLEDMPLEDAAVETFLLGGSAIRILATDPLLPEEMLPGAERAHLTEVLRHYDVVGRSIWRKLAHGIGFDEAPMHVDPVNEDIVRPPSEHPE